MSIEHNPCCISGCNKQARNPHANYCSTHTKYIHKTKRRKHKGRGQKPNPLSLYGGTL